MLLPGREDEDAGEIVVVPAHFFFAEEAYDLALGLCRRRRRRRLLLRSIVVVGGLLLSIRAMAGENFRERNGG